MDEEIVEFFENKTLDDDYDFQYTYSTHDIIFGIVISIACFVAIICDIIIVYLIARTKLMKSKTNVILLNWAIWDGLFLLSAHTAFGLLLDLSDFIYKSGYHFCVFTELGIWCQFMSFLFIIVLISNTLMKSKEITLKYILTSAYTILIIFASIKTILCWQEIKFKLMELCLLTQYAFLLVVIVIKEINLYKKRTSGGISFESKFRLNIGRIYVYSWLVSIICLFIAFNYRQLEFLGNFLAGAFLNSVFILYYIVNSDKKFKICFLSLIRCNFKNNDINDTISFAEDDNVTNEVSNATFNNVNQNRSVC